MSTLTKTTLKDISRNESHLIKFFGEVFDLYLHKKAKRLSHAIFIVTNHIKDGDHIKESIRPIAVKMVSMSVRINNSAPIAVKNVLYIEFSESIMTIITLLELAVITGTINETNYLVLQRELVGIIDLISGRVSNEGDGLKFTPSFFEVDIATKQGQTLTSPLKSLKDNDIKDNVLEKSKMSTKGLMDKQFNEIYLEKEGFSKGQESKKDIIKSQSGQIKIAEKFERENVILRLFKDSNEMSVKDVHLLLPKYSDKTIQRELFRLADKGILVKKGEKRWTSYFLPKRS